MPFLFLLLCSSEAATPLPLALLPPAVSSSGQQRIPGASNLRSVHGCLVAAKSFTAAPLWTCRRVCVRYYSPASPLVVPNPKHLLRPLSPERLDVSLAATAAREKLPPARAHDGRAPTAHSTPPPNIHWYLLPPSGAPAPAPPLVTAAAAPPPHRRGARQRTAAFPGAAAASATCAWRDPGRRETTMSPHQTTHP